MLLLHAWWGLNDDVRAAAAQLREAGFIVEAPDLYGDARVATTVDAAIALRDGVDEARANDRIDEAVDRLAMRGQYGIIGWSLGVYFGWELLRRQSGRAKALVVYYGTGDPDLPAALPQIPPILGHFAEHDEFEAPAVVDDLERALLARGADVRHHTYPGTRHWFAEPSRPEFDPPSAALAWQRSLAFLRGALS